MTFPTFKHRLWADWETRSGIQINRGSHVYSEDSEPLLLLYALDDAPNVEVWEPLRGQPIPELVRWALLDHSVQLTFHNTDFDRVNMLTWMSKGMLPQADLSPWRFYCTMRKARTAGLPGSLEELCKVLQIPETYAKKDGDRLIKLFCVPDENGRFVEHFERPTDWANFVVYGQHDVLAMREACRRTPDVYSETEQLYAWWTDVMNDRGVPIDRALCHAAMQQAAIIKREAARKATDLLRADGGLDVEEFNPASQQAIIAVAAEYGIKLPDARAATLEKLVDNAEVAALLPPTLRQILTLRVRTNKAAVSKFGPMIAGCNTDGRARGLISYYGANRTGRDSGRRVQPQNYARPKIVGEVKGWDMEMACQLVLDGTLLTQVDNPMQILADVARGAICAPAGRKFCDADLAAIEGRKLPWLAGEGWMLDYYRKLDRKEVKYDTYKLAYATVFGLNPDDVDKPQRQLGKVIELFAGYGGGVGALVTFAALFRQDPEQISRTAWSAGDQGLLKDCWDSFDWFEDHKLTFGFTREQWTGLQYIVKAWRAKRPATVAYWKTCQEAFTNAIKFPGQWFPAGRDTWVINNLGANFVRLPSGRYLVYPQAHITNPGSARPGLGFWGVSPFTKRWGLIYTHGARLAENWTQASSRDVLFHNIPQAEAEGYAVVMRIHDQLLTETPDDSRWSGARLAQILRTNPPWAPDLPLDAAGGEFRRFQK